MATPHPSEPALRAQGALLGHYLIKQAPSDQALTLFERAIAHAPGTLSTQDRKLLAFVTAHPWALGIIDSGLVFVRPYSEVRRRLYIMLSILESMPEYSNIFLPSQRSPWYLLTIMLAGIRGVAKAIAGVIFIKGARW
jgi:hypothetical protein